MGFWLAKLCLGQHAVSRQQPCNFKVSPTSHPAYRQLNHKLKNRLNLNNSLRKSSWQDLRESTKADKTKVLGFFVVVLEALLVWFLWISVGRVLFVSILLLLKA